MPVAITASEKPLSDIFSDAYTFRIPLYQRPYAWKREQAAELLGDILAALGNESLPIDQLNPYFLGSVVLIKEEGKATADIVDGQQRLTTLTILLAAIREAVVTNLANGVTKYICQEADPIENKPAAYRLTLRDRDADFFRDHVQHQGGIGTLLSINPVSLSNSRAGMQQNARYFSEELDKMSADQVRRLLSYLILRCYLVVVATPDLDSAYRIFSVMNARGTNLGLTDLMKAEVIGRIPDTERDKYTRIWEQEEEDLGREAFQELFAHIRMIYRKAKQQDTMLKEYQSYVKPTTNPKSFIDDVLKPYSDAFDDIKNEEYRSTTSAQQVNGLFRWLNQIDNFDWVPPALVFLSRYRNSPDKLLIFFTDLERLAAGLMIRRADVNERLTRYGPLLNAIEKGNDLYSIGSPLQLTPSDHAEIQGALNGEVYRLLPRVRQYILLRLDESLSQGQATYDHKVLSVEHVLPQSPPNGSKWRVDFTDQEREVWIHRLANLVLLSRRKNSAAQNKEFDIKKTTYFATQNDGVPPFPITISVIQTTEWTPPILAQRQQQLLDRLKNLWRL